MAEGYRTIPYILLTLGVLIIIYFAAPSVYDMFRGTNYSFAVEFIDQAGASTGEIIHLTEGDLSMSPKLIQALQGDSYGSGRLSEQEYHYYRSTYPNYSQNVTGRRVYYEYDGQLFFLRYRRDDVNLL